MTRQIYFLLSILSLSILFTLAFSISCSSRDSVRLRDVQVLTLDSREYTSGMRGKPPIRQLSCYGGACSKLPNRAQCRNVGVDDTGNVQWECSGDLERGYSFGHVDVSCVSCGEDRHGDPLVLRGSCAASIEVVQNDDRYDDHYHRRKNPYPETTWHTKTSVESESSGMFWIIVILVVVFAVFLCSQSSNTRATRSNIYPDTPPPDYHTPPRNPHYRPTYDSYESRTSNSGPGFMSGVGVGSAIGGLGGYAMGSATSRRRSRSPEMYSRSRSRSPSPEKRTAKGYGGTSMR